MKAEIAQQKLLAAVGGAITVSDKDITKELQTQDTKIKFDYAVLTLDDVKKDIKPSDAELKAFYDQNKQLYVNSIPEKINAKYIVIDTTQLANNVTVTPAELQKYYNEHQDDYRLPETVTVRHILIKTPAPDANGKVDQKQVDAARAKAEDVDKQLKGGANFARPGEEIFGRSGKRERWWTVAAADQRPHGSGVRTGCVQHAGRADNGHYPHQLRLPHHSCRGQTASAVKATGRSEG